MSNQSNPIAVKVLEKEYRIACKTGQESALRASVDLLNQRILEVREDGNAVGSDRVTIMAALNMANDYLDTKETHESNAEQVSSKLRSLNDRLEEAIRTTQQLEL